MYTIYLWIEEPLGFSTQLIVLLQKKVGSRLTTWWSLSDSVLATFLLSFFSVTCASIPPKGRNRIGTETVEHDKKEVAINFNPTPRGSMRCGHLKCFDGGPLVNLHAINGPAVKAISCDRLILQTCPKRLLRNKFEYIFTNKFTTLYIREDVEYLNFEFCIRRNLEKIIVLMPYNRNKKIFLMNCKI